MMRAFRLVIMVLVALLLVSACGGAPVPLPQTQSPPEGAAPDVPATEPPPTEVPPTEPPPTEAPPTDPPPTPTPVPPTDTPEPTALPEGVLFRDDFEGELGDGWEWINEDQSRWSFTRDGWLEIVGANPGFFGSEADTPPVINFLRRELPEGPFEIITHIRADPRENFHQATLFIHENPQNYIALNTGFCDFCLTPGYGFYMETFIDNNPFGDVYRRPRAADATDVYLRLVNTGESVFGYYATEEGEWTEAGAFGNFFEFKWVGIMVSNSNPGGVNEDLVAQFDWFEVREYGN